MTDRSGSPLDVPTLEIMGQRATSHPLVAGWRFRPDAISPRFLEIDLNDGRYPDDIRTARLEIRWFEDGAYSIHYLEDHCDTVWQCRWDRHPKPDAPTDHFHPPPDASPEVAPSDLQADHHLDVLFAVLAWIDNRIKRLHTA